MTIEDLDPLKSEVSNLVELDFTAQSLLYKRASR